MFLSKYRLNIAMLRIGKHRIVKWKSPTPTIVPDQNSTLTGARMSARPRECCESFPRVRSWAEARDHHHGVRGQQESSPLACGEAGKVSRQRLAVGRCDSSKLAFFLAVGGQLNSRWPKPWPIVTRGESCTWMWSQPTCWCPGEASASLATLDALSLHQRSGCPRGTRHFWWAPLDTKHLSCC